MGKKIQNGSYNEKASRIFTDRDEPRKAFERQYEQVKAEITSGDREIHILSYYGLGGIGKSRLLEILRERLGEIEEEPLYAFFDFNTGDDNKITPDRYTVLTSLRNQLCEKYHFHFSLLDTALYVHASKVGQPYDSPEVRQFTDKSTVLKCLDAVGEFSRPVGIAVKLISALDKTQAAVRSYIKQNSRIIDEIERLDAREIYRRLPYFFSVDLNDNLKNKKEPLVVFLDTYERLVNEIGGSGDIYSNDLWLRDDNGPVQRTAGALWVIAGREKLMWDVFDHELADNMEQHLLGDLSPQDSNSFLSGSGVGGQELRDGIYNLTGGVPLYLDLCVSRYNDLIKKGETPDISHFGNTPAELVERFVRYMDADIQQFVYKLVCIGTWTDKTLMEIMPETNILLYEEVKNLSLVFEAEGGGYTIHRIAADVLFEKCPSLIKQNTADALLGKYLPEVKREEFSQGYATALVYAVKGAVLKYDDYLDVIKYFAENINKHLRNYAKEGYFEQAGAAYDIYYECIAKSNNASAIVLALMTKVDLLEYGGEYREALELAEESYAFAEKHYPDNKSINMPFKRKLVILKRYCGDPEAIELQKQVLDYCRTKENPDELEIVSALNELALCYTGLDKSRDSAQKALELLNEAQEICDRRLAEEDPLALTVMANRASTMKDISREKCIEAVELQRKCVRLHEKSVGEENYGTVRAREILVVTLRDIGELEEALTEQNKVVDLCRRKYGENHPDTINARSVYASILAKHKDKDKIKEAVNILTDVIEKEKKFVGENHPHTAADLSLLGHTLVGAGMYGEALRRTKEAKEKFEYLYGETGDPTLSATYGLALCYDYCRQPVVALQWYKKNYELRKSINHPGTAKALERYIDRLIKNGKTAEALKLAVENGLLKK